MVNRNLIPTRIRRIRLDYWTQRHPLQHIYIIIYKHDCPQQLLARDCQVLWRNSPATDSGESMSKGRAISSYYHAMTSSEQKFVHLNLSCLFGQTRYTMKTIQ